MFERAKMPLGGPIRRREKARDRLTVACMLCSHSANAYHQYAMKDSQSPIENAISLICVDEALATIFIEVVS